MAKPSRSPTDEALDQVRDVCFAFAGAEEKMSHGAPSFHVKGKMFLMFADDHHGDGRVAVWCKASMEEQKRLVASDPMRYFVPPYVGVKGWVGVRVDGGRADYVDLAILVEAGWLSVAPPRYAREPGAAPKIVRKPAPPLPTTDPKVARAALERLSALCLAQAEATRETEARHATFRVRKKVFAYFLDNHHRDGVISACVRVPMKEHARAIAQDSKRFYSPAYIGPKGWLGIRLDAKKVDWKDVEERVAASWASAAPKSLAKVSTPSRRGAR